MPIEQDRGAPQNGANDVCDFWKELEWKHRKWQSQTPPKLTRFVSDETTPMVPLKTSDEYHCSHTDTKSDFFLQFLFFSFV